MATEATGQEAFKLVFDSRWNVICVEDVTTNSTDKGKPLNDVKPKVAKIQVLPIEFLEAVGEGQEAAQICYVHVGCRVFKVPC